MLDKSADVDDTCMPGGSADVTFLNFIHRSAYGHTGVEEVSHGDLKDVAEE